MIRALREAEIDHVSGGWFWIALPIFIGGGYTYGKDRAERDNANDANKKQQTCQKGASS